MSAQRIVGEFLADVRKFNKAMDGPSGDAEVYAACAMRDSAMVVVQELVAKEPQVAELLAIFASDQDE